MTRMARLMLATSLSIGALFTINGTVSAQEATPTTTAQPDGPVQLDDIIVTSRRRATGEALQETPVAATAFGAQQLEEAGVEDLTDVGRMAPSVSMQPSAQRGVQNFSIRGMGVSGTTPSDEPAVGVFQDGVYWGSNYGALADLFDVEGVEILRGPQGTLFGRNVTGGAVLVRSARPRFNREAELTLGAGSHGMFEASGFITGPASERVAARVAIMARTMDGYFDNLRTGEPYGQSTTIIVRPSLTWEVTPDLSITALGEWYSEEGDPVAVRGITPCTIPGCAPNLPTVDGWVTPSDYWDVIPGNPGSNDVDVRFGMLEANWNIFGGVLTSVTGYRDVQTRVLTDYDGTPSRGFLQHILQNQDQFSSELRFAANPSPFLSYTVGLYYFEQSFNYREVRNLNNDTINLAGRSFLDNDSFAIFADADFNFTDRLTLTVGLRYTEETKTARAARFGACTLDLNTCTFEGPRSNTDENLSPRVSVSYDLAEHQLIYASATRGFRSGGFSLRGTPLVEPYRAEQVTAYEVGYKADLMNRRVRLNLAAYHNTYSDLQRTILGVSPSAGVVQSVFNAAAATIQGVEVEATALVTDNFELSAAYGYTHARYDEFDGVADPSARRFVRVPESTAALTARYSQPLESGAELLWRASAQYTGTYFYDDPNLLSQPAYTLVDASVAYTNPTGDWTVTLWGRNLTEAEYANWGSTLGFLGENRFPGAPRTFGLRFQARY